jgi:pimeloyl-ACP methyl ester carboxylesterase
MQDGSDIRLDTRQGRLAGLCWRRDGAPRVLALHGWLDNAASFVPLAPHLRRLDLVALDLPGHGHSEHRHTTTRYHFIDYLFNIDAALDALGWVDCHILGHSMGASIGATYAAGAPERVRSLVLLDALGPITGASGSTADRLRRSMKKNRQGGSETRRFDSLEEMIAARRRVSDLSQAAARLICQRAARRLEGQFTWRSDPALNWVSSLLMTEEQVLDLLGHIVCPVLTCQVTPESPWFSRQQIEARRAAIPNGQHMAFEGHHHFHMDVPDTIAETVESFILRHDASPRQDSNNE